MNNNLLIFARKCTVVLGIALCPVFAMGQQTDAVTLPFAFDGGSAEIATTPGMSQNGIIADYSTAPKLYVDTRGDYLQIHLAQPATALVFRIRWGQGNSTDEFGQFDVLASTDGENYNISLKKFTNTSRPTTSDAAVDQETFVDNISEDVRYIRFVYTSKSKGNIGLGNIRIYDRHITVGATGWTTYFTDESFVMPEGMRGILVEQDLTDATQVKLVARYQGGMTVPGSVPLLIKAAPGTYSYNRSTEMTNTIGTNHLHGNFFAGTIASVSGADRYYKLANGADGIGWYYGAEDGGVFPMSSQKAYLALPQVVSQAPSFEYIEEDFEEETAIEEIPAEGKTEKFFENGQILIKKNGHVYNTVGQQIR